MAEDLDYPPHDVLRYSIVMNSENETDYGKFSIDPITSAVKIAEMLDYETERRVYALTIQVSDGVHNVTTTLRVRVLESNDNHPEFTNLPNTTSIYENADNGTYVFTAIAMDKDFGVNAKITYSLDESERRFAINSTTGEITVALSPERSLITSLGDFIECSSDSNRQGWH